MLAIAFEMAFAIDYLLPNLCRNDRPDPTGSWVMSLLLTRI